MKIKKLINIFSDSKINIVLGIVSAILLLGAIAVAVVVFGFVLPQANNAEYALSTGIKATGGVIGVMKGSYEGVTVGLQEGAEEGKEAGLSAEDTEVAIMNGIKGMGRLEVLSAPITMTDCFKYSGDPDKPDSDVKYAQLKRYTGVAVFTVDLNASQIENNGSEIVIIIPQPQMDSYIDDLRTEVLAEYQRGANTGSAIDGIEAAKNAEKELFANMKDEIKGYDSLMQQARDSAEKSVKSFVSQVLVEEKEIRIQFKEVE